MKRTRTLSLLAASAGLFVAATGSGHGSAARDAATANSASAGDEEVLDIIVVEHASSAWDPFWKVVEQGNLDAAEDHNVNLTILAPDEWCPDCMVELLGQALAAQPDGIGVTTSDGALFEDAMMAIVDAGIPLIQYNSGDQRPEDERMDLIYIGQDERLAGQQAGERLIEAGGTKGVCVNQAVGSTNLDQRCRGFIEAFTEAGLEAEVLGIGTDAAAATSTISDYSAANPDVDTYLTLGPNGASPFYAFVEQEGVDVIHGTFDLGEEIVAHIKDGSTLFAIDQQPYIQGYLVVQWLSWTIRYGLGIPADILTGPGFVDATNVETVEALAGTYR